MLTLFPSFFFCWSSYNQASESLLCFIPRNRCTSREGRSRKKKQKVELTNGGSLCNVHLCQGALLVRPPTIIRALWQMIADICQFVAALKEVAQVIRGILSHGPFFSKVNSCRRSRSRSHSRSRSRSRSSHSSRSSRSRRPGADR